MEAQEKPKTIVFPYFSRLNTTNQTCEMISSFYIDQWIHLMEHHGFDVDKETFMMDVAILEKIMIAMLKRNINIEDSFQQKMNQMFFDVVAESMKEPEDDFN